MMTRDQKKVASGETVLVKIRTLMVLGSIALIVGVNVGSTRAEDFLDTYRAGRRSDVRPDYGSGMCLYPARVGMG